MLRKVQLWWADNSTANRAKQQILRTVLQVLAAPCVQILDILIRRRAAEANYLDKCFLLDYASPNWPELRGRECSTGATQEKSCARWWSRCWCWQSRRLRHLIRAQPIRRERRTRIRRQLEVRIHPPAAEQIQTNRRLPEALHPRILMLVRQHPARERNRHPELRVHQQPTQRIPISRRLETIQ